MRGSDELLYKFTGSLRHPEAVSEVDSGAQGATSTVTLTTPPEMQLEHPLNLRTCITLITQRLGTPYST